MQLSRMRLAVIAIAFLAASCAYAQMPQPFSADFASTSGQGQKMTGKWYFASPKMRMDITSMPQAKAGPFGGNMSMIIDGTTQTSYMLMPQQQMYMEFHGQKGNMMNPGLKDMMKLRSGDPCTSDAERTCKKVGTETVNGRSCDKYEVTDKESGKGTIWVDQKLHFPIKMQNADGSSMDFTNLKEGEQDAALFRVPAGYKQFDPSAFGGQRRKDQ